jgi:hypothetical protein
VNLSNFAIGWLALGFGLIAAAIVLWFLGK